MCFRKSCRIFGVVSYIVLNCILLSAAETEGQRLLAVFDLTSDGSLSSTELKTISDTISILANDQKAYTQFSREMMPELFNQIAIDHTALACSDMQCLLLLGNLIGAEVVIGGFITTTGKKTAIELQLIDVTEKRTLQTVSMTSTANRLDFTKTELPNLVKQLFRSPKDTSPVTTKHPGRKSIFASPLLYTGTALVSGGVAAAYYFLVYKKEGETPQGGDDKKPLPLDDIPIPTRGTQ
jgi:hypothetical protein